MKKLFLLVTSLTLVFGLARTSSAETILFDVDGVAGGTVVSVDDFDWVPGNSMLQESTTFVPCDTDFNPTGSCQTATILFQANLNSMTLGSPAVSVYTNGVGGDFFTAVAAVDVILNGFGGFQLVPDSGVFNIYADSTGPGDDLAGTGFTDGTLILSGTSLIGAGVVTTQPNSQDDAFPPVSPGCAATNDTTAPGIFIQCLDQFGTNNYLNYYTLLASGGGTFAVDFVNVTDYINTDYFLNLDQAVAFSFTGTASNLPFKDTNPSALFSSDAVANGDVLGAGTTNICGPGQLGTAASPCINGTGNNIIIQTDAHTSFQGLVAGEVPEPATLSLLGLGLLGSAAARRRQLRNKR